MKQFQDLSDQIEHTSVELKTFDHLRQHEIAAMPKRLEVGPGCFFYVYGSSSSSNAYIVIYVVH